MKRQDGDWVPQTSWVMVVRFTVCDVVVGTMNRKVVRWSLSDILLANLSSTECVAGAYIFFLL